MSQSLDMECCRLSTWTCKSTSWHELWGLSTLTDPDICDETEITAKPNTVLQAVYLDTLGSSGVRWHLVERILGALTKAQPELWEVMIATALETGAASACAEVLTDTFYFEQNLIAVFCSC